LIFGGRAGIFLRGEKGKRGKDKKAKKRLLRKPNILVLFALSPLRLLTQINYPGPPFRSL
jgi:hypothetical protein